MISIEKLIPILASYKSRFLSIWKDEKYLDRYHAFQFSIFQILPKTVTDEDVIQIENS